MNAVDFVKMSLGMSQGWIMGMIEDMRDAPMTMPTPNGGNHPLWCIGHLAYSEANLVSNWIKGEGNPVANWKDIFGEGLETSGDATDFPSIDEVIAKFEEIRATTLAYLETATDEDLDKPSHAPEEMKDFFGTVGQCLSVLPIHFGFHGGQVADARRAAGRKPLMA